MRILIVDQCSGTKSYPESHPLVDQEETKDTDAGQLLQKLGIEGIQAKDLYTGKQQKRITEAVHTLTRKGHEVERYFISAGFGLVSADQRLPPYEATFNSMSKSEIVERKENFELTEQLSELMESGSFDVAFFALGSKYYDAIDLDELLSTSPTETTTVLFNQEDVEAKYEHVISVPARTDQGKEFGSTVVGLKGTYLLNFAATVDDSESTITPKKAAEYCMTDSSASSQYGIDNWE